MDDEYDGTGPCPTCGQEDAALLDYLDDQAETPEQREARDWRIRTDGWCRRGHTRHSRDEWLPYMQQMGYRIGGERAPRPDQPLTLWRGATPENRCNWSWTSNRDAAVIYASGLLEQREVGLVWRATVPPEQLLGMRWWTNGYDEHYVDTAGLTIEPDGLWCGCPVDLVPFRQDARLALDLHEVVHCTRG